MIFIFENAKVCHDSFSRSERLDMTDRRRTVSSEWRMGMPDGPFAIRYSPFAIRQLVPATPLADLPRTVPIAPRQLSKGLKTLKTARAGYWLELAWIWDQRHVPFGSARFCWLLWMRQIRRVWGPLCGRSGPSPRRRRALRAKKRYLSTAWALVDRSDSMT
jgi:hypothetical protein